MKKSLLIIAICMAALCVLSGCAEKHQFVYANDACSRCHDDGRVLDWDASFDTTKALYSQTGEVVVTVSGNAGTLYLCTAVGCTYSPEVEPVPVANLGTTSVSDGDAVTYTLEPGAYIFLIQLNESVDSQLVIVDSSRESTFDGNISLKL